MVTKNPETFIQSTYALESSHDGKHIFTASNGQFLIAEVNTDEGGNSSGWKQESKRLQEQYRTVEEDHTNEMETAWDDVFGAELNPTEVRKARQEEIEYVKKMKLYTKVPIEE